MAYTDPRHHHARFAKAPAGDDWTAHRGSTAPIKGEVYIETVHRTAEGFAVGPRRKARFVHDDEWAAPKGEDGAIVKWRLAPLVEAPPADAPSGQSPALKKAFEELAAKSREGAATPHDAA